MALIRTSSSSEPPPTESAGSEDARIEVETICPICLERYSPGQIFVDYPICPECNSEAIEWEVVPLESFMQQRTLDDFNNMLARWERVEGLRPEYKAVKSKRINSSGS